MTTRILVISDLHLGGAEGFQMCSAEGRERLARFIDWAAGQKNEVKDLRLVLNGDVVDFLAEEDDAGGFSAFVADEGAALRKFARIAQSCKKVFDALQGYVRSGGALTVMLGNHDIELALPAVRNAFQSRLGLGRVEFIYDNQAFTLGPVLIEHGNRYDAWNMVNHNQMREIRSHLSRREDPPTFDAQPGSELVARLMNPLKKKFTFVDLLKPETGAVLPILAVLDPALFGSAGTALQQRVAAWHRGQFTDERVPVGGGYVAGTVGARAAEGGIELSPALKDPFAVAAGLAAEAQTRDENIGAVENVSLGVLLKAFRRWRAKAEATFKVTEEDAEYREPAQIIANRGFRVVVFGHTHLAKRIELEGGALYLNTGTWADLMRLPASVYAGSEEDGRRALKEFLDDVKHNRIDRFRRQVASFARIELDEDGGLKSAGTFFFDASGAVDPISTDGLLRRMG